MYVLELMVNNTYPADWLPTGKLRARMSLTLGEQKQLKYSVLLVPNSASKSPVEVRDILAGAQLERTSALYSYFLTIHAPIILLYCAG